MPISASSLADALTVTQLFDTVAIRIDGPRAAQEKLSILWNLTDSGERYFMELSNGALIHFPTRRAPAADLTVSLTRAQLTGLLAAGSAEGVQADGDLNVLKTLHDLTDTPDPNFAIITP